MNIVVNVTAEDIAEGVPGTCDLCPIALAVKRATGAVDVSVYETDVEIDDGESYRIFDVPGLASRFIVDFDKGNEVNPITFTFNERNEE